MCSIILTLGLLILFMEQKLTPMMAQYKAVKEQYKDCMVFFRLGDFYEMFFEDALVGSKILGITLTSRTKGEGVRVPMCGVPFHAVDGYIAKLTRAGKKIALCDQLTEPDGKSIVEREVVRVITPGTTFDENVLDKKSNNFIACLAQGDQGFGVAYSDVTTGEAFVSEFVDFNDVLNDLSRISPAEIITGSSFFEDEKMIRVKFHMKGTAIFPYDSFKDPRRNISEHFGVKAIQVFELEGKNSAISAVSSLLEYLKETQKTDLSHVEKIVVCSKDDSMPLSKTTIRNLDIFSTSFEGKFEGSLLFAIDKTITALGGRKLRSYMLRPLVIADDINNRLSGVEFMIKNSSLLKDIREKLSYVLDIERILGRISLGSGNARDLVALSSSIKCIFSIKDLLGDVSLCKFLNDVLNDFISNISDLSKISELVDVAIKENPPAIVREGGMINDGYNSELDELRAISTEGKTFISEMQKREIERTGISSLKIKYNQVFGYYIEISKSNLGSVPADYIRKQTLVNAERFITPELKEYEEKVLNSMDRIRAIEYELFVNVCKAVVSSISALRASADAVARLDVICSFAELSLSCNYCKPEFVAGEKSILEIKNGRHPIVENLNIGRNFVPNDCSMNSDENTLNLITGPNMGGKSVYIKQVALIVYLAHLGCFVPAEKCMLSLFDQIFTRVGAHDNLGSGESTFMVEMMEAATILHKATKRSLIVLDEIGRGTSTYDGVSIAWAICEYVHNKLSAMTLFATHYHELIGLVEELPRGKNFSVAVSEKPAKDVDGRSELVFLYKIVEGGTSKSYGIEVAKLAGLPKEVIMNARGVLEELENRHLVRVEEKNSLNDDQMQMFDERAHKAIEELREIDTNKMTPIEALNKIHELKEKGLL